MDKISATQKPLSEQFKRVCDDLGLPLLPIYLPGLLATFLGYQFIFAVIGPWLSKMFFPKFYPTLRDKKKMGWDENVVSFIQAVLICALAGHVVLFERQNMTWQDRVWGITDEAMRVVTIANGYFYWHTMMMVRHRDVFGWGMVAHGLAVSVLMSFGYRPVLLTYAAPSFLYEFSTIFLDIQYALRAMQMEGTTFQVLNGVGLALSFFLSRIVFGTYLQTWLYTDFWRAYTATEADIPVGHDRVPTWMLAAQALSSVTLQVLNYWWFSKIARMVHRKLFAKKVAKE